MFGYYVWLAARSLRRNPLLTVLMVAAIALGIGASMTSFTVLRAMSGNPVAHKDDRVYRVQLDNWAPARGWNNDDPEDIPSLNTYQDSVALYRAGQARRQAAMFPNVLPVEPENPEVKPYMATLLFTHGDFFPMFDVPFAYGSGWDQAQDEASARVVVLGHETNEKLFGGENSVGRRVRMGGEDFTVVGVMGRWNARPKFYEPSSGSFNDIEEMFVPFGNGVERELQSSNNNSCWSDPGNGYQAWLVSECVWMAFWVELDGAADAQRYKAFVDGYMQEQKKLGRFPRPLKNKVLPVSQWLEEQQVVSRDARTQVWLAFAFLLVCLINTIGLLLAKFLARSSEIGLRRAVGASKRSIFGQYLTESAIVGVAGALIGLLLTWLGLVGLRALYVDSDVGRLAQLEPSMVLVEVAVAVIASLLAGVYPTWKACQVAPATQLKSN
jgi:putative ABC transport system permease protein